MLEIQEKFDVTGYEDIISSAGNCADVHITEAMDKGRAVGFIAYAYETDRTVVYACDDGGDLMLCDGLVRSVMFKSVLKGIETMVFEMSGGHENLRKLRFITGESNVCEDLNSFMNGCQSCRNNPENTRKET